MLLGSPELASSMTRDFRRSLTFCSSFREGEQLSMIHVLEAVIPRGK